MSYINKLIAQKGTKFSGYNEPQILVPTGVVKSKEELRKIAQANLDNMIKLNLIYGKP